MLDSQVLGTFNINTYKFPVTVLRTFCVNRWHTKVYVRPNKGNVYIYTNIKIYIYIIFIGYKSSPVLLPLIMFLLMLYLPTSTKPIVSLDVLVTQSSLTPLAVKILSIIPLEMQESQYLLKVIYFCVHSYTCHKLFERETLPSSLPKNPAHPYI